MKNLILILKGFIVGAANVVPGLSGGTIMMSLGIFEDIIHSVNHFFENIKKNSKFLLFIMCGVILSVIIMSRVITYSLVHYNFETVLLFIGLIVGGFPMLFKNVRKEKKKITYIISFIIPFILVISMSFFNESVSLVNLHNMSVISYILLYLIGVVSASAMVVPGLSGSFILILFGYYESIMNVIKDFTAFNNIISNGIILFVFGIGVLTGLFLVIKLLEFLLNKYKVGTYYSIIGFVLASVISIIITNFGGGIDVSVLGIITSIVLFSLGAFATYKLGD